MNSDQIDIKLVSEPLNLQECYDFVLGDSNGGIAVFVGTVRNQTQKKTVKSLEFTAYQPMAIKEMKKIAEKALSEFGVSKIALHHGLGLLSVGEVPVIIAVSSPHREAAFKACQYAIDTLKQTVPIWKKEFFEDGDIWVNAHP